MTRSRLHAVTLLMAACCLAACTEERKPSLVGSWEAEEFRLQSLLIPVGPDFEVTESEVRLATGTMSIPLQAMEASDREVTLRFPHHIGWTFHFDAPDRIHMDLPFAGKVYYRRRPAPLAAPQVPSPAPASLPVRTAAMPAAAPLATAPDAARLFEKAAR